MPKSVEVPGNLLARVVRGISRRVPYGYLIERALLYRNPQKYWEDRGGRQYLQEQESMPQRSAKSAFLAGEIARLEARSILEVGCGYGKQLKALAQDAGTRPSLFGLDFSHSQLQQALSYLPAGTACLSCGDAEFLPFKDKSMDLVFTSAVLLHNPPAKVQRILKELCRVAKKFIVHNEDTNVTFSRYGIDVASLYRQAGYEPAIQTSIPVASDPSRTQFTVVRL